MRAHSCTRIVAGCIAAWSAAATIAQAAPAKRVVWRGTEILEDAFNFGGRIRPAIGTPARYFHLITVNFTYVQEVDEAGAARFVSKKIAWTATGTSIAPGYETVTCGGAGGGDLIGASAAQADAMLKIPCSRTAESNFFGFFTRPPSRIVPPDLVPVDKLRDNCSYSEETPGRRYSVWLTGDFDAVMDVDGRPGTPLRQLRAGAWTGPCLQRADRPGHAGAVQVRARPS
jgi:hypothetical protein